MDLVGLVPKSAQGDEYILIIIDYATWYPEAIPRLPPRTSQENWSFSSPVWASPKTC